MVYSLHKCFFWCDSLCVKKCCTLCEQTSASLKDLLGPRGLTGGVPCEASFVRVAAQKYVFKRV